jgi:hypothetical protein
MAILRTCCFLALLLLTACGQPYADPATLADSLNPAAVLADLTAAPTLPDAADQFAATLNIDPATVRVRLQSGDCNLCSLRSRPQVASLAGLAVVEAASILNQDDEVSLFIPNFSCTFLYDGTQLTPQRCQHVPV